MALLRLRLCRVGVQAGENVSVDAECRDLRLMWSHASRASALLALRPT